MGTIYETVVACIGCILIIGAIILIIFGHVMETGGFDDCEIPKPQDPMIYDAEYIIVENEHSPHSKSIVKQAAIS